MFFPKWNSKQTSRWEAIRARGKAHFVFLKGGLGVGTAMLLGSLLGPLLLHHAFPTGNGFWLIILFAPLAGTLWGILMWNMLEAAYRRSLSENELRELTR